MQENICGNGAIYKPLISIIVPVYNVEKYLDACLQSIINQKYKNLQIIIVDDGSPDSCPAICEKWAIKDNRISVIHQKNMGLSGARNTGLKYAKGDYIAFVDSDDIISDSYISMMYQAIIETDSDIAGCQSTSSLDELYSSEIGGKSSRIVTDEPLMFYMQNESDAVWHRLYSAKLLWDSPFEIGEQNEDILFTFFVFKNAKRYVTLSSKLYYWNVVPPSLSRCAVKSLKNQSDRIVKMLCDSNNDQQVIDAAEVRSALFTFRIITRYLRFGAYDRTVEQEYNQNLKKYQEQLKKDFSIIMKSDKFRLIDKVQVGMINVSYDFYKTIYIKIRKLVKYCEE